jgi:cell wall-associated NlpC family hydrolase
MPPYAGSFDCSSYVLQVFTDVGAPFPPGIRTAEQERQACTLIPWEHVAPGDLLFFENTYTPSEGLGPDGHVASHVGISLGAGTQSMWNAVEPAVKQSDIGVAYWQDRLLSAGRPRHL